MCFAQGQQDIRFIDLPSVLLLNVDSVQFKICEGTRFMEE